jgi:hypothetical protein
LFQQVGGSYCKPDVTKPTVMVFFCMVMVMQDAKIGPGQQVAEGTNFCV